MNPLKWLQGRFSDRGRAMLLYRRGMGRAKKHDHQGAIDDYTTMIDMDDAPTDIVAMALYNRALVYVASDQNQLATKDLNRVLTINAGHVNIRTMAKQMLFRMESRTGRENDRKATRTPHSSAS